MTEGDTPAIPAIEGRPDYSTPLAFAAMVLIGGSIAVAVRINNFELPHSAVSWDNG